MSLLTHRAGLGLALLTIAAGWGALFFFGFGWGRQDIAFEPIGSSGETVAAATCRNIPIRVDGELWHSPDGAVPRNVDNYELNFDSSGETGILTLTRRSHPREELRLTYHRSEFAALGCLIS